MLNDEREEHYLAATGKRKLKERGQRGRTATYTRSRKEPTPAQWRRLSHKLLCRKSHDHDRTAVPEGQKFRCLTCMPLPYAQPPVKAAAGPRDWSPS